MSKAEYLNNLDKRQKDSWTRIKKVNFETKEMKVISKRTNKGFTIRYKRFNGIPIS